MYNTELALRAIELSALYYRNPSTDKRGDEGLPITVTVDIDRVVCGDDTVSVKDYRSLCAGSY
jgi:hypothetical protein